MNSRLGQIKFCFVLFFVACMKCVFTKKLIIILSSTVFVPSPYYFEAVAVYDVYDVHINDCVC